MISRMKPCRWLLLLAGCLLTGCVSGPLPEKAAWPWETTKDSEKIQTGNFFGIRGNVATFDAPPQATKPIRPEGLGPRAEVPQAPHEPGGAKAPPPPTASDTAAGKTDRPVPGEYDFSVRDIKVAPPSYLPAETIRSSYDITAFNRGIAPVSVSVGIDPADSHNFVANKGLPLNAVVKPHTDQALVRVGPKTTGESYRFRTSYSWSVGDYTANHDCPEHYRFPFGKTVKAFASVSSDANTAASTRHAVVFSMPVGTPVVVARKGTIIQIRADKIDILHDDATIATYGHLGNLAETIAVGKAVAAGEGIGMAAPSFDNQESYLQLTVWRPEPLPVTSLTTVSPSAGFDFVSFPLKFCTADAGDCRVITHDQAVPGESKGKSRNQGKRTGKKRAAMSTMTLPAG